MPKVIKAQGRSIDSANKGGATKAVDDKSNREHEVDEKKKELTNPELLDNKQEDKKQEQEAEEPGFLKKAARELARLLSLEKAQATSKERKQEQEPQQEPERAKFESPLAALDRISNEKVASELDGIKSCLKGASPSKSDHARLEIAEAAKQAEQVRQKSADIGRDPTKRNH